MARPGGHGSLRPNIGELHDEGVAHHDRCNQQRGSDRQDGPA
jgi:hypothetical protein